VKPSSEKCTPVHFELDSGSTEAKSAQVCLNKGKAATLREGNGFHSIHRSVGQKLTTC
jgi:hypothetical protein